MLGAVITTIVWYPVFFVPFGLGTVLVWRLFGKNIKFTSGDRLLFILPWLTWVSAMIVHDEGKSLSNVVEAIWLGFVCVIAVFFRCFLGGNHPRASTALANFVGCAAALLIYYFTPGLPE